MNKVNNYPVLPGTKKFLGSRNLVLKLGECWAN